MQDVYLNAKTNHADCLNITIKSGAIYAEKSFHINCKCYSLVQSYIMNNFSILIRYRFY